MSHLQDKSEIDLSVYWKSYEVLMSLSHFNLGGIVRYGKKALSLGLDKLAAACISSIQE